MKEEIEAKIEALELLKMDYAISEAHNKKRIHAAIDRHIQDYKSLLPPREEERSSPNFDSALNYQKTH